MNIRPIWLSRIVWNWNGFQNSPCLTAQGIELVILAPFPMSNSRPTSGSEAKWVKSSESTDAIPLRNVSPATSGRRGSSVTTAGTAAPAWTSTHPIIVGEEPLHHSCRRRLRRSPSLPSSSGGEVALSDWLSALTLWRSSRRLPPPASAANSCSPSSRFPPSLRLQLAG
jgi:hypothetical protein